MKNIILCCDNFDTGWLKYIIPVVLALLAFIGTVIKMRSNSISSARFKWVSEFRMKFGDYMVEIDRGLLWFYNFNTVANMLLLNPALTEEEKRIHGEELNKAYSLFTNSVHKAGNLSYNLILLIDAANMKQERFENLLIENINAVNKLMEGSTVKPIKEIENCRTEVSAKVSELFGIARMITESESSKAKKFLYFK